VIRRLRDDPADVALGTELVSEYVVATAEETGQDVGVVLSVVTDLHDFAGRYLRGGAFLVVETDATIRGAVGVAPDGDATCSMNRLWIRPPFRGAGLGRTLCEAALDAARDLGFRRMILDVVPERVQAIALYRSLGFVDVARAHDYPFATIPLGRDL
jgi:ribosomal protein S18 acetylase RimI-like enzyme